MSYRSPFLPREARAVLAAYPAMPTERQQLIGDFIRALRETSFWTRVGAFYVLAAPTEAAALVNWKLPGTFDLVRTGTVTHSPDRSMKGDGATGMLDAVGYVPTQLSLNSAMIGCYTREAASYSGSTSRIDVYTGTGRLQRRSDVANYYTARVNDTTSLQPVTPAQTGHFMAQRTAADAKALYRDGVLLSADASPATGIANRFTLFSTGAGNWSDAALSLAYAGAAIPADEIEQVNFIITQYLRVIGAA